MYVLLIEPNYYTQYPPLGLLKISTYHKKLGDTVELIRVKYDGLKNAKATPDLIYVTSLWTWAWKPVWDAVAFYKKSYPKAEVWLGGIYLAKCIWEEATQNKEFGCIVVSDEAHRIAPEKFYGGEIDPVWMRLATEGGRNGCPLWLVARRLSLVSKAVTTELQQNFVCFNVEDVDRKRIIEDLGETFASLLGALPPGEAIVKSAAGFKIPGQVMHVKFDKVLEPSSVKYGLEERFKQTSADAT